MTRLMILAAFCLSLATPQLAQAQGEANYTQRQLNVLRNHTSAVTYNSAAIRSGIYNRAVPTFGYSNVNRGIFSSVLNPQQQRRQKPFSSVGGGGSVSPYLALSSPFSSTATNYYTQVRPMLEQQRINQQNESRAAKMQQQITSVAATAPYDIKGDYERAPTGHVAVYMNYGGYYPAAPPPGRR